MTFCFQNSKKYIVTTEEDEEYFDNNTFCRFCEKN